MSSNTGLYHTIKSRRSIRSYAQRKVPREVLSRILRAACWAPSAHNSQPWRFVVIEEAEAKEKLAKAMADAWLRDLRRDGLPEERAREIVRKEGLERFTGSPVLILACLTMVDMDKYPDERRARAEHLMGVQSVAAAVQNLLLAAHHEGLGACWVCAPLFCQGEVIDALRLPEDWEPQAIVTLGYPAEKPRAPARRPLSEVVWIFTVNRGLGAWQG